MTEVQKLYHFTCDHMAEGIHETGQLRSNRHPYLAGVCPAMIWLTDLSWPLTDELGLTSSHLSCDRRAWRFTVETDQAEHWPVFAHSYGIPMEIRNEMEAYAMPMHWWVALGPLEVGRGERIAPLVHAMSATRRSNLPGSHR